MAGFWDDVVEGFEWFFLTAVGSVVFCALVIFLFAACDACCQGKCDCLGSCCSCSCCRRRPEAGDGDLEMNRSNGIVNAYPNARPIQCQPAPVPSPVAAPQVQNPQPPLPVYRPGHTMPAALVYSQDRDSDSDGNSDTTLVEDGRSHTDG